METFETLESKYYAVMTEFQSNPASFNLNKACDARKCSTPKQTFFFEYVPADREATMKDAEAFVKALRARRHEQERRQKMMTAKKIAVGMMSARRHEKEKTAQTPVQLELRTKASYLTTEELIRELLNRGMQVTLSKQ